MKEDLKHCPLCNSGQFNLYLTCKDYTLSKENFSIVSCNNCGFKFTNPRPPENELGRYYESEDYISHSSQSQNLLDRLYKLARVFTIRQKSQMLSSWSSKGNLLDVGCGTGDFLAFNKQASWAIDGVEVNEKARKQAEAKLSQPLYSSLAEVPTTNKYQAITLWHVLEHVSDLETTCQTIKDLLAPDGTLFVAVPNCESFDAQYYQSYWAAYDVPRHLYHFTKASMEQLWQKYDMRIEGILPMKLDAYYVSLLSEKYKNGKPDLLKASWIGMKSNLKARKNLNYSSLIYIIRK